MTSGNCTPPAVTQRLAEVMAHTRYDDLPDQVIDDTRRAVLDWLGSCMAGAFEPPAQMMRQVIATWGQAREATVFGGSKASAPAAALANGVATHILELDDVHKGSTLHAAAPIVPAALAAAEREHANGQAFLLAVALGYEAAFRVGEAINPSHYRFWHPTGTAATFGAAVASGSIMGLNAAQMSDALGSAGTQASGLWEFNADGAMSKHLHPGKAAFNGLLAADLARQGFTGASRILEGDRGFFAATSEGYDVSRITDGLGQQWKISENCFKLYACCGHTHSAVDMALDFREKQQWNSNEALQQLAAVTIETYTSGYDIVKEMNPATPYQAKFSLAYCVAAGLLEGWVGLDQFTPGRFYNGGIADERIAVLVDRIKVQVAPDITAKYPQEWGTRLTFTLNDGQAETCTSAYPRGNPENPVSTTALEDKFRTLVVPRYDAQIAEDAINLVREISQIDDMADGFGRLLAR